MQSPPDDLGDKSFAIETVARAKEGDAEALFEILETFAAGVDLRSQHTWQGPVPWEYVRFIADAFKQILAGAEPATALGIAPKVGRPKTSGASHDLDALAAAYAVLRLNGLTAKQAKSHLQQHTGAAPRTIERAFNAKSAKVIRFCMDLAQEKKSSADLDADAAAEVIRVGARPYTPILKKILRED